MARQARQLWGRPPATCTGRTGPDSLEAEAFGRGRCGLRLPRPVLSTHCSHSDLLMPLLERSTRSAGTRAPGSLSIEGETLPPSYANVHLAVYTHTPNLSCPRIGE